MAWLYLSRRVIGLKPPHATGAIRGPDRPASCTIGGREVGMNMRLTVAVAALILVASASMSSAQYFGRNKVQYESFDFKVLATDHFDIYYYPEEEAAVRLAARMAERWYVRLSQLLQHE